MTKTVAIGCDHAGFPYKEAIVNLLKDKGFAVRDKGTHSAECVDYPDYIHPVAEDIKTEMACCGIIMCGSGNGAAMTANKYQHIRAALCWTAELAALGRRHNNANVLAIPVRFVDEETALAMVDHFINTDFEGGRHERRVKKMCPSPFSAQTDAAYSPADDNPELKY